MLGYWLIFLMPAWAALARPAPLASRHIGPGWVMAWLALTLLIGYRVEVGGDWFSYLDAYYAWVDRPLGHVLEGDDPGYSVLNWLAARLGWGIYGVNLISAALFSTGLAVFCRQQPRPWLALAVAVPYLVIVVAMGYTRQGVAIGLAMLALAALAQKSNLRFVLWVSLAALFHKSAVILLPLAIVVARRGRAWTALWIGALSVLMYALFVDAHADALISNYIQRQYDSQGAAVRVAMNAVPAAIFLAFRRRLAGDDQARRLWAWMSSLALLSVLLLLVSPSSTAVDRMALYLIPVQIFVFSRLPDLAGRNRHLGNALTVAVVGFCGAVQAVWLNFASHAYAWLPYRFYPLELLAE